MLEPSLRFSSVQYVERRQKGRVASSSRGHPYCLKRYNVAFVCLVNIAIEFI